MIIIYHVFVSYDFTANGKQTTRSKYLWKQASVHMCSVA